MAEENQEQVRPSRTEALEYKEELGVVRTREEAEAIVQKKTQG